MSLWTVVVSHSLLLFVSGFCWIRCLRTVLWFTHQCFSSPHHPVASSFGESHSGQKHLVKRRFPSSFGLRMDSWHSLCCLLSHRRGFMCWCCCSAWCRTLDLSCSSVCSVWPAAPQLTLWVWKRCKCPSRYFTSSALSPLWLRSFPGTDYVFTRL